MKLIVPVAGKGTRLQPYTLMRPKALLPVAGKPILDWISESLQDLPITEQFYITGYLGDQIQSHFEQKNTPNIRFIEQANPKGLAHAISLCLEQLPDTEPLLIILGDTLFKANLSTLKKAKENILMTLKVQDPERFGVAVKDENGNITKLVEKPKDFVSDEALIGIYYIHDIAPFKKSIAHILENNIQTNGEYQLTDALQIMIENGAQFRTQKIDKWLDCGLKETLLETNTEILPENNNAASQEHPGSEITPPCYIGKNVTLTNCKIGPNVAIGDNCKLDHVNIKNSIVWENASLKDSTHHNDILADEVRAG